MDSHLQIRKFNVANVIKFTVNMPKSNFLFITLQIEDLRICDKYLQCTYR